MFLCAWLLVVVPAWGLILHPAGEPGADWSGRPASSVLGKWGSNASCVVIGRNLVLTTTHQGGGVGTTVKIEGVGYTVVEQWCEPNGEDIRVAKLGHANLPGSVPLFTNYNEVGKTVVIGGWGVGRGEELLDDSNNLIGYTWGNSGSMFERWCTNKVNIASNGCLVADFDILGTYSATEYEGMLADHDSGGGWFVNIGGIWRVMGLNQGVDRLDESRFGENNYAIRVSSYAAWINEVIEANSGCAYRAGDLNEDCVVDIFDLLKLTEGWLRSDCGPSNNYCEGADFEPGDGVVDLGDYVSLIRAVTN